MTRKVYFFCIMKKLPQLLCSKSVNLKVKGYVRGHYFLMFKQMIFFVLFFYSVKEPYSLFTSTLQVLQGGGLESPTKPKGRPKKNSIPSSEQLSEQERSSADADPRSAGSSSHLESTQEG